MLVIDAAGAAILQGWVEMIDENLKAAEFEAVVMARLARIRAGGKTLKLGVVKKLVRGKVMTKR